MEILETNHAVMTAYEVLQVVKTRRKQANRYKDARDHKYLGDFDRIQNARSFAIPSLVQNSPDGAKADENDGIGNKIPIFCNRILELNPRITPFQIRNILSVRPRNTIELGCIFPSEEEWSVISPQSDDIVSLVHEFFPLDNVQSSSEAFSSLKSDSHDQDDENQEND